MGNCRAVVHYHFKKGMEEQAIKFLETELIKHAKDYGCHGIELWQNGKNPCKLIGIGYWGSLDEARQFQDKWAEKEKELKRFCVEAPHREFCKVRSIYAEGAKKAA